MLLDLYTFQLPLTRFFWGSGVAFVSYSSIMGKLGSIYYINVLGYVSFYTWSSNFLLVNKRLYLSILESKDNPLTNYILIIS